MHKLHEYSIINVMQENGLSRLLYIYIWLRQWQCHSRVSLLATTHIAFAWGYHQLCGNTPINVTLFWNLTVFTALIKSKFGTKPLMATLQFLTIGTMFGQDCCSYFTATFSPDSQNVLRSTQVVNQLQRLYCCMHVLQL